MKTIMILLLPLMLVTAISTSILAEEKKSLPDLFIVGTTFRTTGPSSFSGENIVVPVELRIQNSNWGGTAGPFQLSIMYQYPPPAAPMETELEFTGTRTFSGLDPGRAINASGQIIFSKSQAGKKVKIRAIVDSMTQVSESIETNNASPWLEVQLPPLELRRPPVKVIPKGAK
jgi:CRISPR/Cas system CMR-associated protein Cmr3 (group 5 of RAMP superfamily)